MKREDPVLFLTQHGFRWGQITVCREYYDEKYGYILSVVVDCKRPGYARSYEVHCSPGGQRSEIREVHDQGAKTP